MDEQRLQGPFGKKNLGQAQLVLHQMASSCAPIYPIACHLFIIFPLLMYNLLIENIDDQNIVPQSQGGCCMPWVYHVPRCQAFISSICPVIHVGWN